MPARPLHRLRWSLTVALSVILAAGLAACDSGPPATPTDGGSDTGTDTGPTPDGDGLGPVTANVKSAITEQIDELIAAAEELQAAAPAPDADGWNVDDDAAAVADMKAAWKRLRSAYESVEGAIAVLFPELDESTDQRYDGFILDNGPDDNLFDGEGVTGVHAVERILYADAVRDLVNQFEMSAVGDDYAPPAFPATEQEADDFKNGLCQRLVDDFNEMKTRFAGEALDPYAAYRGIIGSMEEQVEKVTLGATGEDESRYANFTLSDMRGNLAGGRLIFRAFEPLFDSVAGARDIADQIDAGFDQISAAYDKLGGDGLPAVPEGWNPDAPTAADLATPYGQLYDMLSRESDPDQSGSLVSLMLDLGNLLEIPLDL